MMDAIYRHGEQLGEEKHLVPSYVIDFAGCNLNCVFCSERRFWAQKDRQISPEPERFAKYVAQKIERTGRTFRSVQFIGGEPSLHLDFIDAFCATFKEIMPAVKCILNTNGYFSTSCFEKMQRIDGFVFDLKCSPKCQKQLIKTEDYCQTVQKSILEARQRFTDDAITIRHLILPAHEQCCGQSVIQWCHQNCPDCYFNLMDTFIDFEQAMPGVPNPDANLQLRLFAQSLHFPKLLWNGSPLTI